MRTQSEIVFVKHLAHRARAMVTMMTDASKGTDAKEKEREKVEKEGKKK